MKNEKTAADIEFLKELKKRVKKADRDITQKEYALKMIDDWILELTQALKEE